jgi:HipA-like C-terminal domain
MPLSGQKCLKCLREFSEEATHYGLHHSCFLSWFAVKEPLEFTSLARKTPSKEPPASGERQHDNSSFFHGKFRKYSADLGGASYILKVKENEAPELPDVEFLSNQIAELLGIPTAKFYFIELFGERAFVTKNFVEKKTNTNLSHIYHYQQEKTPRDCEVLINIISEETKRYIDIETFVNVCLFDSLIGNHDRHGRNLGLLVTPKGTVLAPIYDNPSALGLENGNWLKADFSPKGRIPTKDSNEPTSRDYVGEFNRLGYMEQVQAFVKKVSIPKIDALIDSSFCSDLMKTAMKNLINKRAEEMQDELSKRS